MCSAYGHLDELQRSLSHCRLMVVQVLLQLMEVVAGPADPWDGMVRIEGEDELQGFQARLLLLLDGSDSDGPGSYVRGGLAWQRRHRAAGGDCEERERSSPANPQRAGGHFQRTTRIRKGGDKRGRV